MSKQERDAVRFPPTDQEPEVEAHALKINWRGEAEPPADAGELTEESEEPDVEGHIKR